MPAYNGRIVIAGVAESDYGRVPNMTEMQLHAQALQRALEDSGLRKEEIYDSFTITVLLLLEDPGFCKKGEEGAFVQGGRIAFGGRLPINTDGGGLSSNHPGMRGIFLIIEAVRQLHGQCGLRQVAGAKLAKAAWQWRPLILTGDNHSGTMILQISSLLQNLHNSKRDRICLAPIILHYRISM